MTIILYARRNVGLVALSYLVAKGYLVKVISDDKNVIWLAGILGCEIVDFDSMGEFSWLFCVHGNLIIPKEYLIEGKMINFHPCLQEGYKGHNPVKRFLVQGALHASISSHYMTEVVDEGAVIHTVNFDTKGAKSYADFYNEAFKYYFLLLDATLNKLNITP